MMQRQPKPIMAADKIMFGGTHRTKDPPTMLRQPIAGMLDNQDGA